MTLFDLPFFIWLAISLATFAAQAFAFVDALTHRLCGGRQEDEAGLVDHPGAGPGGAPVIFDPLSLFNLVGIIAAVVYLVDVRPTLRSLTRP